MNPSFYDRAMLFIGPIHYMDLSTYGIVVLISRYAETVHRMERYVGTIHHMDLIIIILRMNPSTYGLVMLI